MRAVQVFEPGGPDALQVEEIDEPRPGSDQLAVRVGAAGVNFIDIYQRTGKYPLELPAVLGLEGAGEVTAVGDQVDGFEPGDRVAWSGELGSYAEHHVLPAERAVRVPDGVETATAAAVMLQGMTAHYLASSTFPLQEGHTALVHAGAGGVGHLLIQIAKRRGARVITTVSTEEKAELARSGGADEVIRYTETDFSEAVAELTDGGVDVVYDSVGADTFQRSLNCLRPRGYLVLFGASSGPVDELDPQVLNQKGSLFLTRPSLFHYVAERDELTWRAGELFDWIAASELEVRIDRTWPLADAAEAHRYLEGRQSKGKLLLKTGDA
ncbi:MAG: quinone oxidoreductase family protein [Egibacteraceae bacterium]